MSSMNRHTTAPRVSSKSIREGIGADALEIVELPPARFDQPLAPRMRPSTTSRAYCSAIAA
jgi:hypothetical protein